MVVVVIMVDFEKNKEYFTKIRLTGQKAEDEINEGLRILNSIDRPIVTFFGSHTILEDKQYYNHAHELARRLGEDGFAICSGGGPGIMFAANSGATQSGAPSIGFKESLLQGEQGVDQSVFTHQFGFEFMFIRRFALAIKSSALVVYPGGFGTLNELFEYVCLMQTQIADKVPIICIGKEFWEGLFVWSDEKIIKQYGFARPDHLDLVKVVDDLDEAMRLIKEEV